MGQQMDTTRLGLAVAFSAAPFVLQLPLGGVMQGKIAGHVPSENVEMPPVPATKADTQWNREGSALHCPHGNGGEEKMEDSNDLENICPNKGHALSDKATSVVIGAKAPKNRWKVPIKDSRQDAAMQRYIAAMRAHFEEVLCLSHCPCMLCGTLRTGGCTLMLKLHVCRLINLNFLLRSHARKTVRWAAVICPAVLTETVMTEREICLNSCLIRCHHKHR